MIVIINYGAGNIESISNALTNLGVEHKVTSDPVEIRAADKIIFPGVGSFGFMMENLRTLGILDVLRQELNSGKPYLGICLGLQALFEESEESPGVKGIGFFKGKVIKFREGRTPHVGWNSIRPQRENFLFIEQSYYFVPDDISLIACTTEYTTSFCSGIQHKNIVAVQFHPERSGQEGIAFLKRWIGE